MAYIYKHLVVDKARDKNAETVKGHWFDTPEEAQQWIAKQDGVTEWEITLFRRKLDEGETACSA